MMYKFDCGCEIPIVDNKVKDIDGLPSILIDYDNLPDCPIVWELFHSGKTKGIFQLENKLGQDWSKKIKPNDLDELSAVISVIRPGTLKSKLDGTSLTQHFADRKSGKEEVSYIHPLLEPILRKTQGILVYQEQAMRIATDLAGFNLQEADTLRKAIGKKLADVMTQVEKMFMEKSRTFGKIDDETTIQIFSWIRQAQKYSFNKTVSENTVVSTPIGDKKIKDIQQGDLVLCPTNDGANFCEVINKYDHGIQELYEVELESGDKISCTLDHKFLAETGEVLPLREILLRNLGIMTKDGV